jgi:hypothetical protein
MPLHIDEMYAFIATEEDGEGVVAFFDPVTKTMVPMVGADMKRVDSLKPIAKDMIPKVGPIKIVKFTNRVELETLGGMVENT